MLAPEAPHQGSLLCKMESSPNSLAWHLRPFITELHCLLQVHCDSFTYARLRPDQFLGVFGLQVFAPEFPLAGMPSWGCCQCPLLQEVSLTLLESILH